MMPIDLNPPKFPILDEIEVPQNVLDNWQITADLLAEIANAPSALIMRVHAHEVEVFVASHSPGNVYHPGERAHLDTGLYCETVMSSRKKLLVPNAMNDPVWNHNPDIQLGMISYCGFPLTWPSGELFGTLCLLDVKENIFNHRVSLLMERFREGILFNLSNIYDAAFSRIQSEEMESALHLSSLKTRLIFESSRDALMTLEPPSWKFTGANAATLKLFGAADEVRFSELGPWDVSPERQPDGALSNEKAQKMIEIALREGSHFFEWEHKKISGQTFMSDVLLTRMKLGDELFLQATVRDITVRKQTEAELEQHRNHLEELVNERTSELDKVNSALGVEVAKLQKAEESLNAFNRDFESFLDQTTDFIYFKDINSRFRFCSQTLAAITGHKNWHEMIGKHDREVFPPDTAKEYEQEELPVFSEGKPLLNKIDPYYNSAGQVGYVLTNKWPLFDAAGKVAGIFGISRDISDRVKAEAALQVAMQAAEEANRAKSDFLANMSHEIRTPMNAILGMLYLALRQDLTPTVYNHLSKAQSAAQSLLCIINDILDISKIEAGKLQIDNIEFGLDSVLEQLTNAISLPAEHKGIEFLIRYDTSIPPVLIGDPLRLGQVLLNLCNNAIKFTEAGEVELVLRCLTVSNIGMTLQISLRDTGIGMTPEVQEKLFQQFTQGDQSTTRRFGGTGLGLAISKSLVELMGGRIWIEDSQPGKGSTFCFTVQLKISEQAQTHQRELSEKAGPLLKGIRVMVVDDNEASREILAKMLQLLKLEVSVAADGLEAIELLKHASLQPFDVVLMDWRMPGMNGDEVTRRIHADTNLHQPKIVMVSAYGREDVIKLANEVGVDGFLVKPVSPSTLLDSILTVLGRERISAVDKSSASNIRTSTCSNFAGVRLLLVEDNEINSEFASELLRSMNIVVDVAVDGSEAVSKVQQRDYDLVLMDIQMPVMDGLEATRRIRALATQSGCERYATLPIVAMTALAMAQDAEMSRQSGMNDHITKPVDPEHLKATLAKWIPATKQTRESVTTIKPSIADLPADLLALHSIDAAQGIHRIGGKVEAYRKQLHRFREHHAGAAEELQLLISTQGLDAGEAYLHTLKGLIGNLGANELFAYVSELDGLLKLGKLPQAEQFERLRQLLQDVMYEIDALAPPNLEQSSAREVLGHEALMAKLTALAKLLETDLGAAELVLTELLAGTAGGEMEQAVGEIASTVDEFEIADALKLIVALQRRLNSVSE